MVDKSGAAAEGYALDESGNIVNKDGQIFVAADKVQQLPTGETKPDESSKPSSGSSDSSSAPTGAGSETKSGTDTTGSGSSGSSSGSVPVVAPATAAIPAAAPRQRQIPSRYTSTAGEPVYRTVEDYEMREISYCVTCGQDMTGWSNTQLIEHSDYHLDRGESDQWRSEGRQVKVGEHQEIDHYICSCGSTKAP